MKTVVHTEGGVPVAEVVADGVLVSDAGEALDVIATAQHRAGTRKIVLHAANLADAFFDLSTGLAGEILQKVSNYGLALAIVGDFASGMSPAMRDFVRESNEYGQVVFVPDAGEGIRRLAASRHG